MSTSRAIAATGLALAVAVTGIGTVVANRSASSDPARQLEQVMGQYARATDHRDGDALAALFTDTGSVVIEARDASGRPKRIVPPITGRAAIANAVTHAQAPLGPLDAEHHVITAPITEVKGDRASLDLQFTTYAIHGAAEPIGGWPAGTVGAQGTIAPYEIGYYHAHFVRTDGAWRINRLSIVHDLPVVLPS